MSYTYRERCQLIWKTGQHDSPLRFPSCCSFTSAEARYSRHHIKLRRQSKSVSKILAWATVAYGGDEKLRKRAVVCCLDVATAPYGRRRGTWLICTLPTTVRVPMMLLELPVHLCHTRYTGNAKMRLTAEPNSYDRVEERHQQDAERGV